MKNNFFDKLNMMLVNVVFSSVLIVGFSYYFLTNGLFGMFCFTLAAYILFVAVNVFVYYIKKKHLAEKVKKLSFGSKNKEIERAITSSECCIYGWK